MSDNLSDKLPDIQNTHDMRGKSIERTGIKNVKIPLSVKRKANDSLPNVVNATINMYVNVTSEMRGTNMSRLYEVLVEYSNKELNMSMVKDILIRMCEKSKVEDAYIQISFPYFVQKTAPVSAKQAPMEFYITFIGRLVSGKFESAIQTEIYATNLCPCSFTSEDLLFLENDIVCFKDVIDGQITYGKDKIIKTYEYKNNKPLYKLKARSVSPVFLTEGHKVKVTDRENIWWENVEKLQWLDDHIYVLLPKQKIEWDNVLPLLDLRKGLETHKMNISNKVNFNIQIEPEDAYVFGLLFGEGSFHEKGTITLSFGINEEKLVQRVVATLESWGCINTKVKPYPKKNTITVSVSNVVLTRAFQKEFNGLSKNRRIPKFIMESTNKDVVTQFILGWYAADGTHNTTRKLQHINTVSRIAAHQLQLLGLKLGYLLSISQNINNNYILRKVVNVLPLYRITLNQAFLSLLGIESKPQQENYAIPQDDNYFYLKIIKVSLEKNIPLLVYDATTISEELTVPFIVHNSKEISKYGAHNQRVHLTAKIVPNANLWWIEDVITLLETEASCPIFPLLKRPDEKWVTEKAYENPKFVEDLVRDISIALDKQDINRYSVKAEAEESIHIHNAVAYITKDWSLG